MGSCDRNCSAKRSTSDQSVSSWSRVASSGCPPLYVIRFIIQRSSGLYFVNVIAPLTTNATAVLRQAIYFPYAWALEYARGRVLDLLVECETYPISGRGLRPDFERDDQVPFVDVVATIDDEKRQGCVFMLNRDLEAERELVLEWQDPTPAQVLACQTLTGADLKATNTFEAPERVAPRPLDAPRAAARMAFKLPARSYTVAHLGMT